MKTVLRGRGRRGGGGEEGGEERRGREEEREIKGNTMKGQIFNRRCEGKEMRERRKSQWMEQ